LRENAEYEAAKDRQGLVSARFGHLASRMRELSHYTVDSIPHDSVAYGSRVTVTNLDDGENHVFDIVFPEEVDASAGMISLSSPLGRALLNKKVGDEVSVTTPKSTDTYEILEIQTLHERQMERKP
jgi:transcription elongation factor GreA